MRQAAFDFIGNLDTLIAVVVGALLATVGGLIGEHFEDRIERKRRERDAARFFGEIMTTIDTLVDRAIASQAIGDPWGPVTMRLFRTALREAEIYERNRERLFDLHDMELRKLIHSHVVSEILPLEGMTDATDHISTLRERLEDDASLAAEKRARISALVENYDGMRSRALEFIKSERQQTDAICMRLSVLSEIDGYKRAVAQPGNT